MILVSIDPGKHSSGFAVFKDGKLIQCGMAKRAAEINSEWSPDIVIMEHMVIYDRKRWKGDPNDLIDASIAGAFIAGDLHPTVFKTVKDWKGQTPKAVSKDRILSLLDDAERSVIPNYVKSLMHNVIDAIGIGLWELKRA